MSRVVISNHAPLCRASAAATQIRSAVSVVYRFVTDRQTDRQTDTGSLAFGWRRGVVVSGVRR